MSIAAAMRPYLQTFQSDHHLLTKNIALDLDG